MSTGSSGAAAQEQLWQPSSDIDSASPAARPPVYLHRAIGADTSLKPLPALHGAYLDVRCRALNLVCLVRGHDYRFVCWNSWSLYFCARCTREYTDRTFADIPSAPCDDYSWGDSEWGLQ
ncbi:MAG: hypothetical protein J0H69_00570 [Burkholderiales bacterium]|nr:hypothetical protein [Burkholderiales bacterium]